MASPFELAQQQRHAFNRAEALVTSAEMGRRRLTSSESRMVDASLAEHGAAGARLASVGKRFLTRDYVRDFAGFVLSGGSTQGAALYEGSDQAGGYAVPYVVDSKVVQLAPVDGAVRRLATVIEPNADMRFPVQTAKGSAAIKAESGAVANVFTGSSPSLGVFQLSAFMVGTEQAVSMELLQDAAGFATFLEQDMAQDLEELEETLFLSGSGFGQPQGLLGNVGAGITAAPDAAGNLVTVNGTLSILDTLLGKYHENASWLMQRTTGVQIRKAQLQGNPGDPVAWTRQGGQDYLHGYPVEYSSSMPAAAAGTCPVLFGDFAYGYMIADRGGSGLRVKILDQTMLLEGLVQFLAYRRTDGRVRRSEAIQSYNIAAS